ncbi:MAG: cysteine hydrolase family protein [Burkholderiales bacterium]|nr:cysteine hydrolase family protein [Burkholderiales bacterium]
MADTALLIIDIQNDYFPDGAMTLEGADAAAQNAARLLAEFRARHLPVFHMQHLSVRPGATFFIPGTPGAEIHSSVTPAESEKVIEKNYPNSFRETALETRLEAAGTRHLVIAGMMTHMCVDATVRQAFDLGYRITLGADACATRDQSFGGQTIPAAQVHGAFLAALSGLYARVLPVEDVIRTLEEK